MKKQVSFLCILLAIAMVLSLGCAAMAADEEKGDDYYIIGAEEDTFSGLYKRMCISLDLKNHPVPEPDEEGDEYLTGDYEMIKVLKDDDETYEYIGYVYSSSDKPLYIIRRWIGYHEEGVIIAMDVYYSTKGEYIGNIQRDLTNGLSNSSSRMPYYIPSQGTHKLK